MNEIKHNERTLQSYWEHFSIPERHISTVNHAWLLFYLYYEKRRELVFKRNIKTVQHTYSVIMR